MRIREAWGRALFEWVVLSAVILLACAQSSSAGVIIENLLPPCSAGTAPCRVEDSPPPNPPVASPPVPTNAMLPCPLSVPCIANDGDHDDEVKAPVTPARSPNSIAGSAALVMRVMPADSADNSSASRRPDGVAAMAPASRAQAPAAKAPAAAVSRPAADPVDVSLEGSGDLKRRAEQSVMDLGTRLARVDASAFNADDTQTYLQALDLARAARRALTDRDYLAALDLSRKATNLAGTLSTSRRLPR